MLELSQIKLYEQRSHRGTLTVVALRRFNSKVPLVNETSAKQQHTSSQKAAEQSNN